MPYYNCPTCRLTVYSAASWAHVNECPRCGGRLGDPRRSSEQVASRRHPGAGVGARTTDEHASEDL